MKTNHVKFYLITAASILVLPFALYGYFMYVKFDHHSISASNADWGDFGSFLGGILSPAFTLLSIYFIYLTISENNRNHQTQIEFMNHQQNTLMISELANAFNEKLNNEFGVDHPALKDQEIYVYRNDDALPALMLDKSPKRLSTILIDYLFYEDPYKEFSHGYLNFVWFSSKSLFTTLEVILNQCADKHDKEMQRQALSIFNAKVDDSMVTALIHSIVDMSRNNDGDLEHNETIFKNMWSLREHDQGLKYLCSPYLKLALVFLIKNSYQKDSPLEKFKISTEGKADVIFKNKISKISTYSIFNEMQMNGEINPIRHLMQFNYNEFSLKFQSHHIIENDKFVVKFQREKTSSLEEEFASHLQIDIPKKHYVMTFTITDFTFNLVSLEFCEGDI